MTWVLGIGGLALVGTGVAVYWGYTLAGVDALGRYLKFPRRWLMTTGALLSLAGGVAVGSLGLILYSYAVRRQWLFPRPAARFVPIPDTLENGEVVAVLAGGEAVALRWASKKRTLCVEGQTLVHCGLARSVTAFEGNDPKLAAVLPHATGFEISNGRGLWDGVDGRSLVGGSPRQRVPVMVCTAAVWRNVFPSGRHFGPAGSETLPPAAHRQPRVPGARGVEDPLAWGVVREGRWFAVSLEAPGSGEAPVSAPAPEAAYYLGRWAAIARGLTTS